MSAWTPELECWITQEAQDAGFDTAGIADLWPPDTAQEAERFANWVAKGYAGEMEYLKRRDEDGVLLRSAVQRAIPWAQSVIVCAMNYNSDAPKSLDKAPPGAGWIARYAWSGRRQEDISAPGLLPTDYHDELLTRLRSIEAALHEKVECQTRCYVDTGPIVERSLAARAGVGWIGKNTCVLNQRLGSWLLLGVVITSIPVVEERRLQLAADRCGSCTRCIDACPTDALIAPREMNASLCISYLTIEKKGAIPEELREPMGRQVFGCDICQDVCPWNRRAPFAEKRGMLQRSELVNPALDWLAAMDVSGFRRMFRGSPLERTRRKRLHRNVAIAMGNSKDRSFLPQLQTWAVGDDPILAESSAWAITQIEGSSESGW